MTEFASSNDYHEAVLISKENSMTDTFMLNLVIYPRKYGKLDVRRHVLILACNKKSKMPKSGRAGTWNRSIEGIEVFT